jgi:hypothetical protein
MVTPICFSEANNRVWQRSEAPALRPRFRRRECSGKSGTEDPLNRSRTSGRRSFRTGGHCPDSAGCGHVRIVEA